MGSSKNIKPIQSQLTEKEQHFCELFVFGGSKFAGQATTCFTEAFGEDYKNPVSKGKKLLAESHIAERIKELSGQKLSETETIAVKLQVAETLKAIMRETANSTYVDKLGIELSPAPLRAVSVNAAKALMDLYPIRHAQESRLTIEGADGNVIFNVIVPQSVNKDED